MFGVSLLTVVMLGKRLHTLSAPVVFFLAVTFKVPFNIVNHLAILKVVGRDINTLQVKRLQQIDAKTMMLKVDSPRYQDINSTISDITILGRALFQLSGRPL